MTTVAEIIAHELVQLGVQHFFLLTGGDHALFAALRSAGIRQVLARSESGAVYMADAYARVTKQPAFVYGQFGPGAANIAGSLAEPWWSSSPVVALTSAMRRQHRYRFEYQDLDQSYLFASVTKWQAEAPIPEQVPHLIRTGVRRALSGNPGPVYIGIPNDLMEAPVDATVGYTSADAAPPTFPLFRPKPPTGAVQEVARLLSASARPLIVAGNGIHLSGAYEPLRRVAERLNIPVVTSLSGKGAIPEGHALSAGVSGRYSRNYTNQIMKDADILVAVGTRLAGLVTDSYRLVSPGTTIIHVDVDAVAVGHNFPASIEVQADARTFLEDLAATLEDEPAFAETRSAHEGWTAAVAQDRDAWKRRYLARASGGQAPMAPEALTRQLQEMIPPGGLVLADTGYAAAWVGSLYEVPYAGRGFLRSDGSLGWALPAALGAKLADPSRPVVAVTGDGGFGYHVGELETAVRLQMPVIVVILNNRSLAFEYHIQQFMYGAAITEVDDFVDVDYAAVARAFGAAGERVDTPATFVDAFGRALSAARPTVIDALIDKDAIAPVTRYDSIRTREL